MRLPQLAAGLFAAAAFIGGCSAPASAQTKNADASPSSPKVEKGNAACASCHAEIYTSYKKTVMAGASGAASEALISGEFNHKPSGVHYRVYPREGRSWMSYERPGPSGFRGERELLYFIGSGVKGRTYLFSDDGFLFEAPINWYSQEGRWNMTPGYTEAREIPMNLPALVDCLNCHSSGLQPPVAGTDNRFSGKPFLHDGITCQRCHGAGEGHGEGKGDVKTTIVNPAKLSPERRDAICMACHFEGAVSVEQPGKHTYQFQPGENLSDYIHYFLLSGTEPQKPQALSQFEALSQSMCKIKSGDKMWCGSCHDPHQEPEQKAAYYRSKCLACHEENFAAKHHPDKPDCVGCHMPALPSKDVAHTEATDHRIRRNPTAPPLPRLEVRGTPGAPLVAFPESAASLATTRDFALAWETLALRNVENAPRRAEGYLRKAVVERPEDPVLLAALGFVEQARGREKEARELYEHALRIDPAANDAAANLGIMEAQSGNLRRAVELWQGAFARVPYRSAIGIDMAIVFCAAGKRDEARKYVERVLEFNPDYGKGKSLLEHLKGETGECKP
jgi:tetratricopeptide (TPR) repeat protein